MQVSCWSTKAPLALESRNMITGWPLSFSLQCRRSVVALDVQVTMLLQWKFKVSEGTVPGGMKDLVQNGKTSIEGSKCMQLRMNIGKFWVTVPEDLTGTGKASGGISWGALELGVGTKGFRAIAVPGYASGNEGARGGHVGAKLGFSEGTSGARKLCNAWISIKHWRSQSGLVSRNDGAKIGHWDGIFD